MIDKLTLAISDADALQYYNGGVCQCGSRKYYGQPLCRDCGQSLPPLLARGLYQRAREELREALEDALVYLDLPLPPAPDLKSAGDLARHFPRDKRVGEDTSVAGTFYR